MSCVLPDPLLTGAEGCALLSQKGLSQAKQVRGGRRVATWNHMTWVLLAAVYAYVVVTPDPKS